MKKLLLIAKLLAVGSILLFAGFKSTTRHGFIKDGKAKITAKRHHFDQPVDYNLATACVQMYQHVYSNAANVDSMKNAYSTSADFGAQNLSSWALDMANNTNAVTIKMCFGIYTKEMVAAYPTARAGRLTIFLFPVDANGNRAVYNKSSTYTAPVSKGQKVLPAGTSGSPTNPYNIAGLEP
jgi:hypothetical protein